METSRNVERKDRGRKDKYVNSKENNESEIRKDKCTCKRKMIIE